jgi:GAF domain-containing protein
MQTLLYDHETLGLHDHAVHGDAAHADAAPTPHADETQRLAALRRYRALDTPDQRAFDDVARTVAHACRAPMAAVTLVDQSRYWIKSMVGVGPDAPVPVDVSFSKHATLASNPLIVPDATKDERFARHPLVAGAPYLRFYAGAPLETPDGWPIGALWVADCEPRELAGGEVDALTALARQAMALLEFGRVHAEQAGELTRLDQVARERSCREMVERGLLQELRRLRERGYGPELRPMGALGYRHLQPVLEGSATLADALREMQRDTRRFARRQRTWLRKIPQAIGLDPADRAGIEERVAAFLREAQST